MTALESEYRYLIRKAIRSRDTLRAQTLVEHAFEHFDLDLSDALPA